jgi:hypothetical protein
MDAEQSSAVQLEVLIQVQIGSKGPLYVMKIGERKYSSTRT